MSKHSLLLIGCGDLGQRVGKSLAPEGWHINAVRRTPPVAQDDFEWIAADYSVPGALDFAQALRPDIVLASFTPTAMDVAGYRRGFTRAAANVLSGLGTHRPTHLFMVSSTRVYAEQDGGWVDEHSPLSTSDERAMAIIDAEQQVLKSGLSASVVRFGGVYGDPHGRLLNRIRAGQITPAAPVRFTNRIHRDDCAGFLVHLIRLAMGEQQLAPVYNGVDNDPAPAHEVERWIATTLGCDISNPAPPPRQPAGHKRCRNTLLRASGYELLYPDYRAGYAAVCREAQR
ncbi:NAD(P)H-binding protein [Pseudohalioglobus lutimaris]|uniref:NAD(P)-binding domain-containing protein n=1 Tax=Pseudohalioglobus lutimaris TaxID=1737061 RepID=A0A2N5X8C5_9GAMM|nr:NAD(P)H-binding protein [Pseudohalioglobus lutimaris]PLW70718.1 hypothetical protein C0039_00880 [Pseudohalioglobus lutimaris]